MDRVKPALRALLPITACAAAFALTVAAYARPPLTDPTVLNIGLNCQWQSRCMKAQSKAMKHALKFIRKTPPPVWKIELCNHNAGRSSARVDWVGYDHCLGNPSLAPLPPKAKRQPPRARSKKHRRR